MSKYTKKAIKNILVYIGKAKIEAFKSNDYEMAAKIRDIETYYIRRVENPNEPTKTFENGTPNPYVKNKRNNK